MAQPVVWFEVMGQNADNMKKFYGDMFDWNLDLNNPMKYGMLDKQGEGTIPGGVGVNDAGPGWSTFYVKVDAIDDSLAKAEQLGARVLLPKMQTPDGGHIAVFADPEGHPVGLVEYPAASA